VTAVAVALVAAYAAVEPSGIWAFLAGVVTLLSVFAASLAIWDALESLFFDWVPFARESAAYRWIGSLDLHITPQAPETT
jgi:hypothetical protein